MRTFQFLNNANTHTSGGCHPHSKVFTRLSKQLTFSPTFLPYRTYQWGKNNQRCFFCKSNWGLGNCLQNCSHTYPIDFFFCDSFLHWNSLTKVSHSAECNMTNILRGYILFNSKTWDMSLKYLSILQEATTVW